MATAKLGIWDSRFGQMNDLLRSICEELQVSPTAYDQAVNRYTAVCNWLEADGSAVAVFNPTIYPQGSMKIGTTVKPFGRDEYDLDLVCEFRISVDKLQSPLQLLKLLEARMREHELYRSILEMKNRCVRLNYANEFHLDILPACPDLSVGGTCLFVPDRKSQTWKPSNPKGYADWFESRCELALKMLIESRRLMTKAEPIPPQEATEEKAILKRVVQLLKRWRDVRYQREPKLAPISMVLTTMAAQAYGGERTVTEAMTSVLNSFVTQIASTNSRVYVLNPANRKEDLSERWGDAAQYRVFVDGIREFHEQWDRVLATSGIHNVSEQLEGFFGEPVKAAIKKQARTLQDLREKSSLRVAQAGLLSSAPAIGVPVRSNTFHGKW
ncbi:MAG: nucleotidyltransferase [Acidobacteriia bacterium]|nr:nucleotidyltransferase [Terriglobia bacterium]